MIQAKWISGLEKLTPVYAARQQFSLSPADEQDLLAWHFLLTDDGKPCSVLRLYAKDGVYHLDQVGIFSAQNRHPYDDLMLRMALKKLAAMHAQIVYAHVERSAQALFQAFGFCSTGDIPPTDQKHIVLCLTNPSLPPGGCGKQSGDHH